MNYRPRIYYTETQRALMWDRWQKGDSMHEIARLFDRSHSSIQRILSANGGVRPAERTLASSNATLLETASIWRNATQNFVREELTTDAHDRRTGILLRLGSRSRWFFAEISVIVVGVLIALAIDQWRSDVEIRELELEYIRQIVAELRTTEDRIEASNSASVRWDDAASQLKAAFDSGKPIQLETLRQLLTWTRYFNNPVAVHGSAEALVSTGSLRLLNKSCVSSAISTYLANCRDNDYVVLLGFEEL